MKHVEQHKIVSGLRVTEEFLDERLAGRVLISDFDGVMVDSVLASIEAYRRAGAHNPWMSTTFHWTEWATEELHKRKNEIFINELVHTCKKTRLGTWVESRKGKILSSCSPEAFEAMVRVLGIDCEVLAVGVTKEQKLQILKSVQQPFLYLDDSPGMCKKVWSAFGPESVLEIIPKDSTI